MSKHIEDMIKSILRAMSEYRIWIALGIMIISVSSLVVAATWPKSFTSYASIYADNSNILAPLMEGNAVATGISDQARMAQDILFKREFDDKMLEAAGYDPTTLSQTDKDKYINGIQENTIIENVSINPASLIRISHTDASPIRAFTITQTYTALFLEQSVLAKQAESRNAFEFIQNQVVSYQTKLQQSENALSKFKSENNLGTLASANNRIAGYQAEMEGIELDLVQINTQITSVEGQLAGESVIAKDLSEINAIRGRINALQVTLDDMRSRFHDTYPDVIQVKNQIADLQEMLESGNISTLIPPDELNKDGATPLHQELRSQLAALQTSREAKLSQHAGISELLRTQEEIARQINASEAELAELNRDYNVTQDFYNEMLQRLENARVSMQLDEQQQGVTFKIQESPVIPTQPDGFAFPELMLGSIVLALSIPIGLIIVINQLDTRIKFESQWSADWPPLLVTIPPMQALNARRINNIYFLTGVTIFLLVVYGTVWYLNFMGLF